jgi:hypothetical protein
MIAMSPSDPKRETSSAKLAAISAATFLISLGICGYSLHTGPEFGGMPGFLSLLGMLVSLAILIAVGLTAVFRLVRDKYYK